MERQFVAWNEETGVTPDNYAGALYGFIKKKLERKNRQMNGCLKTAQKNKVLEVAEQRESTP